MLRWQDSVDQNAGRAVIINWKVYWQDFSSPRPNHDCNTFDYDCDVDADEHDIVYKTNHVILDPKFRH